MNANRVARVAVSAEFLVQIMKHGMDAVCVVKDPLPADAILASVFSGDGWVWVVVTSEQFEPVGAGEVIPILPVPRFEKIGSR